MTELTHLSLFSGIGGLDLAAEWAGFKTVGQCEFADYPYKVLCKHWPDVHKWRDIRTLTGSDFYEQTGLRTVTVLSGGFHPCQPFSVAGKRRGKEDDRYLWPEMLRVISEVKPTWVIGENVAGILTMGQPTPFSDLESDDIGSTTENMVLEEICQALENIGYEVQPILIPACSVGAPHQRYRTFIVGYSKHDGLSTSEISRSVDKASDDFTKRQNAAGQFKGADKSGNGNDVANAKCGGFSGIERRRSAQQLENSSEDVANSDGEGLQGRTKTRNFRISRKNENKQSSGYGKFNVANTNGEGLERCTRNIVERKCKRPAGSHRGKSSDWWSVEPDVGRVANGVPFRVDRLKCLGNAVVPQQAYPIFKAIADIEIANRLESEEL